MPTIGVSVAVPEPWGSELQQYRIDSGDDSARHIPTHITLLPPYALPEGDLAEVVVDFVTPFRDRTLELLDDRAELQRVLEAGAQTAGAVARRTLADVYDRVGFVAR